MPILTSTTSLAYWYRIDGTQTGFLRQETDTAWSVAGRDGTPVGVVAFTTAGLLQAATYVLSDAGGAPVVGYAEKDQQVLGPDGSPVGTVVDPAVWWGQAAVAKFQVRLARDPHRFDGAWMWDTGDSVVASLGQTRTEGVGAFLQLDRSEGLTEPLATATLVLPFLAHLVMLRATQQDVHRRFRRSDRGLQHFGGEQTDLL